MGLVVSCVVGELDCLVGGLVLVERLVGWLVGLSVGRVVLSDGLSVLRSVSRLFGWLDSWLFDGEFVGVLLIS